MSGVRAALHAHSSWSYDGTWRLRSIARLFGALGVDVVMMSEHDDGFDQARFDAYRAACAAASTTRCRLAPGIEYSCPNNDVHILTWGLRRFFGERRPVLDTLRDVRDGGGVAVLAHPRRRDVWRIYDDAWTPHLDAVEIWNRKTDGVAPGDEALTLAAQAGLPGVVGVDFHRLNQLWPLTCLASDGGGDPEAAVIAALRAGALAPQAFGRDLREGAGWRRDRFAAHARLEAGRRRLKRLRRRA